MDQGFVFGYGSLLAGAEGTPCRLPGHRRRFGVAMDNSRTLAGYKYFLDAATGGRPAVFVAFLDVTEDPAASVAGVAFPVTAAQLAVLDARERNYRRVPIELDGVDGPAWAYTGLHVARERYERAARRGLAVVSRAYLEHVRTGFAAHGLDLDTAPEVPVTDLTRVDVPGRPRG